MDYSSIWNDRGYGSEIELYAAVGLWGEFGGRHVRCTCLEFILSEGKCDRDEVDQDNAAEESGELHFVGHCG